MPRLPRLVGTIRRRMLVNFRVDAEVMQRQIPAPFQPKLLDGSAVGGICLIRLEQIRPRNIPAFLGLSSENAAHRVAVTWTNQAGEKCEGVYIPRRDSSSIVNRLVGGRLFPGEHQPAEFRVSDDGTAINLAMRSQDGNVAVTVRARASENLPGTSRFASLAEASAFFEGGSLGYSETASGERLDGLALVTDHWWVEPLAVEQVESSYFADTARFPEGSVEFDCALLMRNIEHEWETAPSLRRTP